MKRIKTIPTSPAVTHTVEKKATHVNRPRRHQSNNITWIHNSMTSMTSRKTCSVASTPDYKVVRQKSRQGRGSEYSHQSRKWKEKEAQCLLVHSINQKHLERGWVVGEQWPRTGNSPETGLPMDNGAIRTEQRPVDTETVSTASMQPDKSRTGDS